MARQMAAISRSTSGWTHGLPPVIVMMSTGPCPATSSAISPNVLRVEYLAVQLSLVSHQSHRQSHIARRTKWQTLPAIGPSPWIVGPNTSNTGSDHCAGGLLLSSTKASSSSSASERGWVGVPVVKGSSDVDITLLLQWSVVLQLHFSAGGTSLVDSHGIYLIGKMPVNHTEDPGADELGR